MAADTETVIECRALWKIFGNRAREAMRAANRHAESAPDWRALLTLETTIRRRS